MFPVFDGRRIGKFRLLQGHDRLGRDARSEQSPDGNYAQDHHKH
jgi:hypothetical protein